MCPVNSSAVYDVIIIGAGISGLGAARILSLESFKILVLEARHRPGGRIHSVRLPLISNSTGSSSDQSTFCNHDNLSVFRGELGNLTPSSELSTSTNESLSSQPLTSPDVSPQSDFQRSSPKYSSTSTSSSIEVDLGANYLIGCSNRQSDQPLFHLARLLKVPTAASVGDLCKKYRGWECIELAVWRNHLQPDAPQITMEGRVEDAVFLFDKVTHLATQYYLRDKERIRRLRALPQYCDSGTTSSADSDDTFIASSDSTHMLSRDSVKVLFEKALSDILLSEARHGVRPSATFRDSTEEGLYQSMIARYFCYVNPLDRLPFSVLEELCEANGSSEHLNIDDKPPKRFIRTQSSDKHLTSLVENLAVAYPTVTQREAYRSCAERKLTALYNGTAGSQPDVAKAVNVRWEDRLVTGRFSDLLQPLLDNVPVVYRAVVKEIDWSGSNPEAPVCIRATVTHGSKTVEHKGEGEQVDGNIDTEDVRDEQEEVIYKARHCIISVPVGVLKGLDERSRINFTPALPATKRQAIDRLGLPHRGAATHNKVVLCFRAPEDIFWDADAAHLKCPDPRLHILNLHRYGKPGVLCAHLWGGSGLSPTGLTDAEVVQVILDLLAAMYPQSPLPKPTSYLVTRWSEDPFALGAYTTGEPESEDADRVRYAATLTSLDAFRLMSAAETSSADSDEVENQVDKSRSTGDKSKPPHIPRLLFAGEGTLTADEAKECTHGALQTGIARAIELLPYLTLNARGKTDNSSSMIETDDTNFFPDIPRQKIVHYLLGRIPSRKLEINPDYSPLGTDDSNGLVDGFVVRRPKRLSTVTSRCSSVWGMPSSTTNDVDKDDKIPQQQRTPETETVSRGSGRRGGSRSCGKRKSTSEASTPVKRRHSHNTDIFFNDDHHADSCKSVPVLTSAPRPGANRGRTRSFAQYGHHEQHHHQGQHQKNRLDFEEGHLEMVSDQIDNSRPQKQEQQRQSDFEDHQQQQPPLQCEFEASDPKTCSTNTPVTAEQLSVEQLLSAMNIRPGPCVDIFSSLQVISDCWPSFDSATKQIVLSQLKALLDELRPYYQSNGHNCSITATPTDLKTGAVVESVHIDLPYRSPRACDHEHV